MQVRVDFNDNLGHLVLFASVPHHVKRVHLFVTRRHRFAGSKISRIPSFMPNLKLLCAFCNFTSSKDIYYIY